MSVQKQFDIHSSLCRLKCPFVKQSYKTDEVALLKDKFKLCHDSNILPNDTERFSHVNCTELLVFYSFLEGKGREATNAKSEATSLIVYRENGECAFAPTTIVPVVSEL